MRLYAEAFWLTAEVREEGRSGTGGAAAEEVGVAAEGVAAVGVAAVVVVAAGLAPALSQGFGGEAMVDRGL